MLSFCSALLCFLVYSFAYAGRYSYSANIAPIIDFYGVNKETAGLVNTFFFISYGVGQLLNAFLCKIYPKRYVSYLVVLAAAIPVRMVITFVCVCINYNTIHLLEILGRVLLPEAAATAILAAGLYFPLRKICMFMNR